MKACNQKGFALLSVVILSTTLFGYAVSYLERLTTESRIVKSVENSLKAEAVAEAGVEEVMWEFNYGGGDFLASEGWVNQNGSVTKTVQDFTDSDGTTIGSYGVTVHDYQGKTPQASSGGSTVGSGSRGQIGQSLEAAIEFAAVTKTGYPRAITASGIISLNGSNTVDSYDSTSVPYGPLNQFSNGDIATTSDPNYGTQGIQLLSGSMTPGVVPSNAGGSSSGGQPSASSGQGSTSSGSGSMSSGSGSTSSGSGSMSSGSGSTSSGSGSMSSGSGSTSSGSGSMSSGAGSASSESNGVQGVNTIKGDVSYGTGGSLINNNEGVITGTVSSGFRKTIAQNAVPSSLRSLAEEYSGSSMGPLSAPLWSAGNYKYQTISIDKNITVQGDVSIYILDSMWMNGSYSVLLDPGATLTIYFEKGMYITGTNRLGMASGPQKSDSINIYGTKNATSLMITGTNDITGVFDVPSADLIVTGNNDIYGAAVAKTGILKNTNRFHYDESLGVNGDSYTRLKWTRRVS